MDYDVIIGLEIHTELKSKSKMFCACKNGAFEARPNTSICPICLGHPGTLPRVNAEAVKMGLLLGLALNGKINYCTKFDRKNYFYPDLPKGYQISQYDLPLIYEAQLDLGSESVAITRIHLEEDTAKRGVEGKHSILDFNRAGTPLLELVTEPVIKNSASAKLFCQKFQQILQYLEISDANMEKGEMRCEVNISLQKKGSWDYINGTIVPKKGAKLNPKVELKNLNSFKAVEKSIEYEIKRQSEALEKGEELFQETRGWDENLSQSRRQRIKESSADYRYFPEPDLPPLIIDKKQVAEIKKLMVELSADKKKRFIREYGLKEELAETIINDKKIAHWFEASVSELQAWEKSKKNQTKDKKLSQLLANWLSSELFKYLKADNKNIHEIKITPENFAELISLLYEEKINSSAGQAILKVMYEKGGNPTELMSSLKLEQIADAGALDQIIKKVINNNPDQVKLLQDGKLGVLQFLVGKVMAESQGQAKPQLVLEKLKKEFGLN